jgi:hypothetical protein
MAQRSEAGPAASWLAEGAWTGPVAVLRDVPVFCNALWPTAAEARSAPLGQVELCYSPATGYLWNRAFDPRLVAYNPAYENSLHHSPRFVAYVTDLADRLIARYGLRGRQIVEIGPGEGNFLALLCERGRNWGLGYDAAYDPERQKVVTSPRMRIVRDRYPYDRPVDGELVVCQHVLEHLDDPVALVEGVRRSIADDRRTAVYFEVPDATYMVEQLAVWDLIYEHVSYFSAPTLDLLFRRCGFEVTALDRAFGDQYLYLEGLPAPAAGPATDEGPDVAALAKLTELVGAFGEHLRRLVEGWTARLGDWVGAGSVAVWGAGSKGVSFLNLVPPGRDVAYVVDVNPNKSGLFVPGTGQMVVGPDELPPDDLDLVVVMNPLYVEEIRRTLAGLGCRAEVVAVTD